VSVHGAWWDRLQPPATLNWRKQGKENGWIVKTVMIHTSSEVMFATRLPKNLFPLDRYVPY